MTLAELALAAFGLCNSLRVVAYIPQILTVARDRGGASGVSCTTWAFFAVSHVSTVAYALFTLGDQRMALIFGANALCCGLLLLLIAWRRYGIKVRRWRRSAEPEKRPALEVP